MRITRKVTRCGRDADVVAGWQAHIVDAHTTHPGALILHVGVHLRVRSAERRDYSVIVAYRDGIGDVSNENHCVEVFIAEFRLTASVLAAQLTVRAVGVVIVVHGAIVYHGTDVWMTVLQLYARHYCARSESKCTLCGPL